SFSNRAGSRTSKSRWSPGKSRAHTSKQFSRREQNNAGGKRIPVRNACCVSRAESLCYGGRIARKTYSKCRRHAGLKPGAKLRVGSKDSFQTPARGDGGRKRAPYLNVLYLRRPLRA